MHYIQHCSTIVRTYLEGGAAGGDGVVRVQRHHHQLLHAVVLHATQHLVVVRNMYIIHVHCRIDVQENVLTSSVKGNQ